MSAMRIGVLLCLLVAGRVSASYSGVLLGTVRDEMTGRPLVGASVIVDGTELGNATDLNGSYMVIHVPESTWTATASHIGHHDATLPFSFTKGCTVRLDFNLFGSYMTDFGARLTDSGLGLYYQRTGDATQEIETLVAPKRIDVSSSPRRYNAAKISMLTRYRQSKDTWAALAVGPYDSLTRRRLDVGPGYCYYREWREEPSQVATPGKTGHRRHCGGFELPPLVYEVESMSSGYLAESESDGLKFVKCTTHCPNGKLLFLKLTLSGGGSALF